MRPIRAVTTLAFLCLAGCSLGPDYRAPDLALPAAYRGTSATAAEAWPATDWWRGFNSEVLNQLIEEARGSNFDIQAAVARVRQADAQVRISGSPLLPRVDGSGKVSYERAGASRRATSTLSASGFSGASTGVVSSAGKSRYIDSRSYSIGPSISYEIDLWGRLRAAQDSAEANALFSRFDQQTVALTAVTSVANTWFQALASADRVAIVRRNLRDAEQIQQAIQGRLSVGTASLLDVSQQGALVAGLRAQIPGLQNQLAQQVNGLGILVGRAPQDLSVTPDTLTRLSLPEIPAGLPSQLLGRRPDIAAAEAQLLVANANIREARANFFPQITLTGSAGLQSAALTAITGPGSILLTAAASVAQTIFDNGLKGGQYEQARARYDELLADYRRVVVQALTDVQDALDGYRLTTEQEKLEQQAVDIAQRASDIARAQLLAGTSDIVTALQAQTTLFNDLDNLAQVRLARFQSLLNLYKALGGGWDVGMTVVPPSTIFHGVL